MQARVDYLIEGRVVDAQTAAPLPGLDVHVHWPQALSPGVDRPILDVRTGPRGGFWVRRSVLRPGTSCQGCLRPWDVEVGSAVGAALTLRCHRCEPVSVGLGASTVDFLARGPDGAVQVVRSLPRPRERVWQRWDGTTVVRYRLPDLIVEVQPEAPMPELPTLAPEPKAAPPPPPVEPPPAPPRQQPAKPQTPAAEPAPAVI